MPLHVVINSNQSAPTLWPVVNLDGEKVRQRFVEPWLQGAPIVARGRHFNAGTYWLSIYESASPREQRPGDDLTLAVNIKFGDKDVTDDYITEPFGSHRPAAPTTADQYAEDRRKVMVVHGRNSGARDAMFTFLRALHLNPLEWSALVGSANAGAPYIGQVLDAAFAQAQAVVVLFTPDDLAQLRPSLLPPDDPDGEGVLQGQARPNVFFEAGMALGAFPTRTILAELGRMRPASDLTGRHAVRLDAGAECRQDMAQRLLNAGCEVDMSGTDWLSAGEFVAPAAVADEIGDAPVAVAPDAPEPANLALVRRIDALRADLEPLSGYAEWHLATAYNAILDDAASELARAEQRPRTSTQARNQNRRWSTMSIEAIRANLGQLRVRLTSDAPQRVDLPPS